MADLDVRPAAPALAPSGATAADGGTAARAQLRAQIAALELRLAQVLVELLAYGDPAPDAAGPGGTPGSVPGRGPRVLDLGELERVRDGLAARVSAAEAGLRRHAERRARARVRLEQMRLAPGRHRFERITRAELGEGRCGVWEVRPRLGLLGMLMGWWELKLSSGCPLSGPFGLPSGRLVTAHLSVRRDVRSAIARTLRRHRPVRATVQLVAVDQAGNGSAPATAAASLRG